MQRSQKQQIDRAHEQVLEIKRVSKKTSGGNYITFTALVAVGDGQGKVGLGTGRAMEVPSAIQKAIIKARKNMISVPVVEASLPHQVMTKFKSAKILLKPAPLGTGLKVGSVARTILELCGIQNASGKIIGTRNHSANAYAVMAALGQLKDTSK
ncbi:MAG: 30S ribosomal protein S5 [Patescibacteria group bacterium]|nr:30S ribosomal protein S5 [Patescibacteria group bacterium]